MVVFYLFITNLFIWKKKENKLDKINIKYDNVLDETKKSKVKKSIKVKKGKLFSFLDEKNKKNNYLKNVVLLEKWGLITIWTLLSKNTKFFSSKGSNTY